MNRKLLPIGIVVVAGLFVSWAATRNSAATAHEPHTFARRPGLLTAIGSNGGPVTIENPRHDEGMVFHITEITWSGASGAFSSLIWPQGTLFVIEENMLLNLDITNATGKLAFETPLPLETEIKYAGALGEWVVLHGYFDKPIDLWQYGP